MKPRAAGILLVSLLLGLSGCGGDGSSAPTTTIEEGLPAPQFAPGTTMKRIQEAGRFKVGVRYDQPGFSLENPQTKQLEGFEIEIAKLLAQGIFGGTRQEAVNRIEFVQTVSVNRQPFIEQGTVDAVIAGYVINDARKQAVDFAGPYYVAQGDVMVKSQDTTIRSVPDLNGKAVCIVRNSPYEQSLRSQAPLMNLLPLDTYKQCTDELTSGRVQAVVADDVLLAGLVQTSSAAFKLVGTAFADEPFGIGLKKGDTAFRTFLNERLLQTYANGNWRTAFESTLGRFDLPTPAAPQIELNVPASTTTTSVGPSTSTSTPATIGAITTAAPTARR